MSGREPAESLKAAWGLQGFAIAEIDVEEERVAGGTQRVKVVRLQDLRHEHVCPCCGGRIREPWASSWRQHR